MSPSNFRLFVTGVMGLMIALGLSWYVMRELKVRREVTKCMGGYEDIRSFCETSVRRRV
jgi:high-affinity Fe2+/Pb2+ permease